MDINAETIIAVTGASKGIGRATALHLAGRGARLALLARSADKLAEIEPELRRAGAADLYIKTGSVADAATTTEWLGEINERFGGLDVLINNAGFSYKKRVEDFSDAEWDEVIGTNLTGPFRLMRDSLSLMRARGGGHIINVSSIAGEVGFATGGPYCASKHGLQGLSECLLAEVRREGIKVSILGPGSVDTRFDPDAPADTSWKVPPEEIARTIAYMIESPRNTMVTKLQIRPTLEGRS